MNATIVDLRYRMKDVLRAIDSGEVVTVLYRGKAKAALVPISAPAGAPDERIPDTAGQPFFGLWSDRADLTDPAAWVRNLRQPRALAVPSPRARRTSKKPK